MIKPLSTSVALISLVALITSCAQIHSSSDASSSKAIIAWDWNGIIGTGQSLAVGQNASAVASTSQPYHNLKLYTDSLAWPIDPANPELKLVPLVEPIGRRGSGGWPTNIAGETPHSAMANELTALVEHQFKQDFVSVHTEVGENGRGMALIKKDAAITARGNGHAFEGTLVETRAITRFAKEAGKSFGVGAITITHGESDSGNAQYESMLHQLWQDYNTDIPPITGQTGKILMIVSQQHGAQGNRSPSTIAQWKVGMDYPDDIVCSGPKYQYPSGEGLHLTTEGYRELGEKYAQVYFERVLLGHHWLPLEPEKITRAGRTLTVQFHVPVAPMVWDATMDEPHQATAEWKNGKGFEVMSADGKKVAIDSVKIKNDTVVIKCAADPGANVRVSYALYQDGRTRMAKPYPGFAHWGMLRDSDPFQGSVTGKAQANYAVAFEMTAP